MTAKFYIVAATFELEQTNQMHIELNGEEILLIREDENYFAVSYFCSHAEFTLEGGLVSHGCITCPYHGAEFELASGKVLAPPAFEPLKTYPVLVENDTIAISTGDT